MKITIFLTALVAFLVFLGCGGGNSTNDTKSLSYDVSLNDDWIKNAIVKDSKNQRANYKGRGVYSFKDKPKGFISLSGGTFENTNVKNKMTMKVNANSKIISPISSFFYMYPNLEDKILSALNSKNIDYSKTGDEALFRTSKIIYVMASNNLLDEFADSLTKVSGYNDIMRQAREVSKISPRAITIDAYLAAITMSFFDIDNTSYISKITSDAGFVIKSIYPKNNDTNIPITAEFNIVFNQTIEESSVENKITLKKSSSGNNVPIDIDIIGATITIEPSRNLAENTEYILSISDQIKSESGFLLENSQDITFATSQVQDNTHPEIVAFFPSMQNYVMDFYDDRATIEFSEPISKSSAYEGISIYDEYEKEYVENLRFSFANADKNVTIENFLINNHNYHVEVNTDILDLSGNNLTNNTQSVIFKVVENPVKNPTITRHVPKSDAKNVSEDTKITLTFNKPIEKYPTLDDGIYALRAKDNRKFQFDKVEMQKDNTIAIFSRTKPLPEGSRYVVTIPRSDIVDKERNEMQEDESFNFLVGNREDNDKPNIKYVYGAMPTGRVNLNDSIYQNIDGKGGSISVEFSEVIEQDSIKDIVQVFDSDDIRIMPKNNCVGTNSNCVTNGFLISGDNKTYQVGLELNDGNYTVRVIQGAKDLAGNTMDNNSSDYLFRVGN